MPLNRPPLALGQGARGVQDARRWVADLCTEIGRPELVECAQLGVSELVTNALLHGEPPITVRVRGTSEHPRVEVRDSSVEAPILPSDPLDKPETDDLLLTFGRGLSIVARCSDAWGAEIEDDGKVVWFAPAADFADGDGIPGSDHRHRPPPPPGGATRDRVRVHIIDVPLAALRRLPAPLPRAAPRGAAARAGTPVRLPAGQEPVRPVRRARPAAARRHRRRADRGCPGPRAGDDRPGRAHAPRHGRRPCPASWSCSTSPTSSAARSACSRWRGAREQRKFQVWFLHEFVRQANGESPLSWLEARSNGHAKVT